MKISEKLKVAQWRIEIIHQMRKHHKFPIETISVGVHLNGITIGYIKIQIVKNGKHYRRPI